VFYSLLVWLLQLLGYDPRGIFVFWDGSRWQRADPIIVSRTLEEIPDFHPTETPNLLATSDALEQLRVAGTIANAVRIAFGIRPLSENGLTELECLDLYTRFTDYMTGQKKSIGLMPTSPPPTESERSEESTTSSESASGSIAEDNTSEPRGQSAGESAGS
jgi:hypothetical protein